MKRKFSNTQNTNQEVSNSATKMKQEKYDLMKENIDVAVMKEGFQLPNDFEAQWEIHCECLEWQKAIMEKKSGAMEGVAVLSAFLVGFAIDNVLGLDESEFNSEISFQLFTCFGLLVVGLGMLEITVLTMVALYIKRLIGRDDSHTASGHWSRKALVEREPFKKHRIASDAYAWYQGQTYKGRNVHVEATVKKCYYAFILVLACYLVLVAIKSIDAAGTVGIVMSVFVLSLNAAGVLYLFSKNIIQDLV